MKLDTTMNSHIKRVLGWLLVLLCVVGVYGFIADYQFIVGHIHTI